MGDKTTLSHESELYHGMASWYERVFERFFGQRIHDTISQLEFSAGSQVLELGVGTGLSLSSYPTDCHVTAIDLSESMLSEARRKVSTCGWQHIELRQMDATQLDFPDNHFDFVHAFHLVTVVPDHQKLISEMLRVCKPGGTMVIINHFQSPRPWVACWVNLIDPITRKMGWSTRLSLQEFLGNAKLRVHRRYKTTWRSLFTVVVAEKDGDVGESIKRSSVRNPNRKTRKRQMV